MRYLLLARYGGVWLDADQLLVRDVVPLLRTGPFTGQRETRGKLHEGKFYNGAHSNVERTR